MTIELVSSTLTQDDNAGVVHFDAPTAGNLLVIVGVDYRSRFVPLEGGELYETQTWRGFDDGHGLGWLGFSGGDAGTESSFGLWARTSTGEESLQDWYIDRVPYPVNGTPQISLWGGEFSGVRGSRNSVNQTSDSDVTPSFDYDYLNGIVLHAWAYEGSAADPDPTLDPASVLELEDTYGGTLVGDLQVVRNDAHADGPFFLVVQAAYYETNGTKPGLKLLPGSTTEYTDSFIPGASHPTRGSDIMPLPGYAQQVMPGPSYSRYGYRQEAIPGIPHSDAILITGYDPWDDMGAVTQMTGQVDRPLEVPTAEGFFDDDLYTSSAPRTVYPPDFDDEWATSTTRTGSVNPDSAVLLPRWPNSNGVDYMNGATTPSSALGAVTTFTVNTQAQLDSGYWQVLWVYMRGGTAGAIGEENLDIDGSDGWVLSDYWVGTASYANRELFVFSRRAPNATDEVAVFTWPDAPTPGTRYVAANVSTYADSTHSQRHVEMTAATPQVLDGSQTDVAITSPNLVTVDDSAMVFRFWIIDHEGGMTATPADYQPWVTPAGLIDDGMSTVKSFVLVAADPIADPGSIDAHVVTPDSPDPGLALSFTSCPPSDPLQEEEEESDETLALDDDVDYYQVQLARDAAFTDIVRTQRAEKGTSKTFRVKKPRKNPFHARVRAVDSLGNKSEWATKLNQVLEDPPVPDVPTLSFDFNEDKDKLRAKTTTNNVPWDEDDISRYEFGLEPTQWTKTDGVVTAGVTHMKVTGPNSDYRDLPNHEWANDLPNTPFDAWFPTGEQILVTDVHGVNNLQWTIERHKNGTTAEKVLDNRRVFYFPKKAKGRKSTVHELADNTGKTFAVFPSIPVGRYYKARVRSISRDSRQSDWSDWTDVLKSRDGATTGDIGGGGGGSDPGEDPVELPSYPYERIFRFKHAVDGSLGEATTQDSGTIVAFRATTSEPAEGTAVFRLLVNGATVAEAVLESGERDSRMTYIESFGYGATDTFQVDQSGGTLASGDLTAYVYVTLDADGDA